MWVAVAVLGVMAMAAAAAEPPLFKPVEIEDRVLENGLRVVTIEDFSCPIVSVQVWYHVGSKDEHPSRQGFAHMFEHMMFRGTDRLGPEDHFDLIHAVGGSCNAFTSFDVTTYLNTLPASQLDLALWLEAERMMFLAIDQEGFETERKVVEEERRSRNLNAPYGTIPERVLEVVCTKHPYRWTPIGRIAHLEAATVQELQAFWDTYYVPANATLVIAGAVSHEEAQEAARARFGWIPAFPAPPRVDIREPEQKEPREVLLPEPKGPIPLLVELYRGVPADHPDAVPLQMLLDILAGGESSRLYVDLVRKRHLCAMLYGQSFCLEQDGILGVVAAMHPVRYVLGKLSPFQGMPGKAIQREFEKHIERLREEGVTEEELEKARNRRLKQEVSALDTVAEKAAAAGNAVVIHGSPDWLNRQYEEIQQVTCEDLLRVARTYLVPERRTRVVVKPDKSYQYDPAAGEEPGEQAPPAPDTLQKAAVARPDEFPETPPTGEILDEVPTIDSERRTLANGLTVVVLPDHEMPLVNIRLGFKRAGWSEDPAHPGVAAATFEMLTKGTEKHTAEELSELIESQGIGLGASASMDQARVGASALSDRLEAVMELLAEVVLTPTFPKRELRMAKRQWRAVVRFQEKDPATRADQEIKRRLFAPHFYGRKLLGEPKEMGGLKRARLVRWWETCARPGAAVLYIGGDVNPEAAFELAERRFGDWAPGEPVEDPPLPKIPERADTHIYLVDQPGAVQSEIRVGQVAFARNHPDYCQALVLSQIFGGAFGSRLNKATRIEGGLTYGAKGGFEAHRFGGSLICSTHTKTESTGQTLQLVLNTLAGMRDQPPTEEEMHSAKNYLLGQVPSTLETSRQAISLCWRIDCFGLPDDELERRAAACRSATSEEVVRLAQKYIDPEKLTVVVVGDADEVRKQLEAIAPVSAVK